MKKIVSVQEVELEGLVGQKVLLMCMNYFYTGVLARVNDNDVLLKDASIVYETGPWTEKTWKDAQKLPSDVYVRMSAIESYMAVK